MAKDFFHFEINPITTFAIKKKFDSFLFGGLQLWILNCEIKTCQLLNGIFNLMCEGNYLVIVGK